MPVEWRRMGRSAAEREQWLAWRRPNLNMSEIPAVLGRHPHKSRLELWAAKRGVELPQADNSALRRGRWFEPAVAEAVAELRPQWELERGNTYFLDAERRLGATPDYFIRDATRPLGSIGILQCKTANREAWDKYWAGGEECSDYALLQNFGEISIADLKFGAVAVLLIDSYACECRIFDIEPYPPTWDWMLASAAEFHSEVDEGRQPPADYEADREVIRALRSASLSTPGKSIDFSGNADVVAALDRRGQLKDAVKQAEAECESIDDKLVGLLGDAEKATGVNGWNI